MELRHLRYFVVLAEELHFGRAASRLCITQPPLSFNIRQLEEELGVRLFDRDQRTVTLTGPGRAFRPEAQSILEQAARAKNIVKAASRGQTGWLNVSFSGSLIYAKLPRIINVFNDRYPSIEVTLTERYRAEQIDDLMHGRIHAGILDTPKIPAELDGLQLCDDAYVACIPDSHPLANSGKINLANLADDPLVMFPREGAPSHFDRIISACVEAGFEPKLRLGSRQWLSIIALVAEGFGVAIVPSMLARTGLHGVRFIPLSPTPMVRSTGYLIWAPERMIPALTSFIEVVGEVTAPIRAKLVANEAVA